MDVTPLVKAGAQIIQSYNGGVFQISGERYEGAVFVLADRSVPWVLSENFSGTVADLRVDDFEPLFDQAKDIDVLLLGCGARIAFLDSNLRSALKERGLNIDVMDSGAACRTYNVLMAEGRRVVAALLPAV